MQPFPDASYLVQVPVRALASEPGEGEGVVLIRPKILSPRWAWLVRLMGKPNYRVKLDARGAAVWRACDGSRSVAEVAEAVSAAFPEDPETPRRTALFLRELAKGGFVRFA
ncbi:PqqD family peptide modification chaperone [Geothrix sp. 21YS21S-4]|uniref:PqqD family peptide modification chaperone n=1 Tax=Geothrix sp. 21YS21S-4 TaxID=3068889 RepID=UPI0027B8E07C|nr:PqqD family peptide modification chaperone [Geothrix sp. 21YS21S-4]